MVVVFRQAAQTIWLSAIDYQLLTDLFRAAKVRLFFVTSININFYTFLKVLLLPLLLIDFLVIKGSPPT
jgi:hypothetical protein